MRDRNKYVVRQLSKEESLATFVEKLLTDVYVSEGYADADVARSRFTLAEVFARGDVFGAIEGVTGQLVGMVVVVAFGSPASRLAMDGQSELHLLAVSKQHRRRGIGDMLVKRALQHAAMLGFHSMVLWTQPGMIPAHRLYESNGFQMDRLSAFEQNGRSFWVFRAECL